jgi:hypothetical protein
MEGCASLLVFKPQSLFGKVVCDLFPAVQTSKMYFCLILTLTNLYCGRKMHTVARVSTEHPDSSALREILVALGFLSISMPW